jgi:hypothetical protein
MNAPAHHIATVARYVKVRLAQGIIQVQLPQEVFNKYRHDDSFRAKLSDERWFNTGIRGTDSDCGIAVSQTAISDDPRDEDTVRAKERMILENKCQYITILDILGTGAAQTAILLPRAGVFQHPGYEITPMEGCFCPRDNRELSKCLGNCLREANNEISRNFPGISTFLIASESPSENIIIP